MASKKAIVSLKYSKSGTRPPIYIAGSFSNPPWQPEEMQCSTNEFDEQEFTKEIEVVEGVEYQYKFRIGYGDWWTIDDHSPQTTDSIGNHNNLLLVPINNNGVEVEETEPLSQPSITMEANQLPIRNTEPKEQTHSKDREDLQEILALPILIDPSTAAQAPKTKKQAQKGSDKAAASLSPSLTTEIDTTQAEVFDRELKGLESPLFSLSTQSVEDTTRGDSASNKPQLAESSELSPRNAATMSRNSPIGETSRPTAEEAVIARIVENFGVPPVGQFNAPSGCQETQGVEKYSIDPINETTPPSKILKVWQAAKSLVEIPSTERHSRPKALDEHEARAIKSLNCGYDPDDARIKQISISEVAAHVQARKEAGIKSDAGAWGEFERNVVQDGFNKDPADSHPHEADTIANRLGVRGAAHGVGNSPLFDFVPQEEDEHDECIRAEVLVAGRDSLMEKEDGKKSPTYKKNSSAFEIHEDDTATLETGKETKQEEKTFERPLVTKQYMNGPPVTNKDGPRPENQSKLDETTLTQKQQREQGRVFKGQIDIVPKDIPEASSKASSMEAGIDEDPKNQNEPVPIPSTTLVVSNGQLNENDEPLRKISPGGDVPKDTLQFATPGGPSPKTGKLIDSNNISNATDEEQASPVLETRRQGAKAAHADSTVTPKTVRSAGQNAKERNFLKAFWRIVFVDSIGGLIVRLCGGDRRGHTVFALSALTVLTAAWYFRDYQWSHGSNSGSE